LTQKSSCSSERAKGACSGAGGELERRFLRVVTVLAHAANRLGKGGSEPDAPLPTG